MVCCQPGLSSIWSIVRLVFHQYGLSTAWSHIRMVCRQAGIASIWSVVRLVFYQYSPSSGWYCISMVCCQPGFSSGGLSSGLSFIIVDFPREDLASGWSLNRVVVHRVVSHRGSHFSGLLSFITVVCLRDLVFVKGFSHQAGVWPSFSLYMYIYPHCVGEVC